MLADDDLRETYSKVGRRMWNDPMVRDLSWPAPNGLSCLQRLITGTELTNIPGVAQAWEAGLAQSCRWDLEGFRNAFAELEAKGFATADWSVGLVWCPYALGSNRPENPNVVKGWRKTWSELPDCALKREIHEELREFVGRLGPAYVEAFDFACPSADSFGALRVAPPADAPPGQQDFALIPTEPKSGTATKPPPRARQRGTLSPSMREYLEAYSAGVKAGAGLKEHSLQTSSHHQLAIRKMAHTYAKTDDGRLLDGQELRAWFRQTAEAYVRMRPSPDFEQSWSPTKCLQWLDGGRKPRGVQLHPRGGAPLQIAKPGASRLWSPGDGFPKEPRRNEPMIDDEDEWGDRGPTGSSRSAAG